MITLIRDTTRKPEEKPVNAKAIHRYPDALGPEAVHTGRRMTRSR